MDFCSFFFCWLQEFPSGISRNAKTTSTETQWTKWWKETKEDRDISLWTKAGQTSPKIKWKIMQPKQKTKKKKPSCPVYPPRPCKSTSAPWPVCVFHEFVYSSRRGDPGFEVLRNTRAENNQNIISRLFKALPNEACNNFCPAQIPSPFPLAVRFMVRSFVLWLWGSMRGMLFHLFSKQILHMYLFKTNEL